LDALDAGRPSAQVFERARVSRDVGMWWPERKPDETADRVEELVDKRSAVLRGPNDSGKDAAFRALDDVPPHGETRGAFRAARFYARRIRVRRT
jgi:hypothetical protein